MTTPPSRTLPLVLAGCVMLGAGLGLGYLLARRPAPPPSPVAQEPQATADPKAGKLQKLGEQEKKELLSKKSAPAPSMEPSADSPFLQADVVRDLNAERLPKWRQALALMEQGNARAAKPILGELESSAGGLSYRDAATVLLAEARVSTGEVEGARSMLGGWRKQFPSSPYQAQAKVTEGKTFMQEGKRVPNAKGAGSLPKETVALYRQAIGAWDEALAKYPTDPAVADGLFHKVALQAEMGDAAAAEETALTLADHFPRARNTPRGLFNAAKSAHDRGEWAAAERLYQKLVDGWGQDKLASNARSALQSLRLLGKPAPELDIVEWLGTDYGGLAKLRGKVVVLIFWATWCPHCKNEMPHVEEQLWQKWKDDGVVVLAVTKHSKGQTTEAVREFISSNGYTVPVAIDSGMTSRAFGVSGIPASAIIDKKGNVAFQNHPAQITDALLEKLTKG